MSAALDAAYEEAVSALFKALVGNLTGNRAQQAAEEFERGLAIANRARAIAEKVIAGAEA